MRVGLVSVLLPSLFAGCIFASSTATVTTTNPTLLVVDPAAFRGDLACGETDAAAPTLRRWVATLYDVSIPADAGFPTPFPLASSAPATCTESVSFAYVLPGHCYFARIDAYDTDTIAPQGVADAGPTGSPVMVDTTTGAVVAPRWTTTCGEPPVGGVCDPYVDAIAFAGPRPPTVPALDQSVTVGGCLPLRAAP